MLSDYTTLVTDYVRDDASKISSDQRTAAITAAVERYSRDRPKLKAEDITGASGQTIALPASYVADFSEIRSLEYPTGDVPPTLIPEDEWAYYLQADGVTKIQLINSLPAASTVRATYTIKHTLTSLADTIPVGDREAVAKWASALLCDQLAAFYANEQDSAINADSVQTGSRAQEYAKRARDYRKFYLDMMGVDDKRAQPAGTVVNMQRDDARGQDLLYHGRRYR